MWHNIHILTHNSSATSTNQLCDNNNSELTNSAALAATLKCCGDLLMLMYFFSLWFFMVLVSVQPQWHRQWHGGAAKQLLLCSHVSWYIICAICVHLPSFHSTRHAHTDIQTHTVTTRTHSRHSSRSFAYCYNNCCCKYKNHIINAMRCDGIKG